MKSLKYLIVGALLLCVGCNRHANSNLRWVERVGNAFIVAKSTQDQVSIQMFDANTKERWSTVLQEKAILQPLQIGDHIIILTVDGTIYSLDRETGCSLKSSFDLNHEYVNFASVLPSGDLVATLTTISEAYHTTVIKNYVALFKNEHHWVCKGKIEINGIKYPTVFGDSIYLLDAHGGSDIYMETAHFTLEKKLTQ